MPNSNFAVWVVRQGIEQIVQKNWRGKAQYPMAAAVMTPAGFAFDVAVYLAHVLRDHQYLLWQLVGPNVRQSKNLFEAKAANVLRDTPSDEKTLVKLWAYPMLRLRGVDTMNLDSMKDALKTKLETDELEGLIFEAWGQGLAMSLSDPGFVFDYQNASYELVDNEKWQEMRSHGLELSETQDVMSLDERASAYLSEAVTWATEFLSDETAAELAVLLENNSEDEVVDALSQAAHAERERMLGAANKSPQILNTAVLVSYCAELSVIGVRDFIARVPELERLYRDDDYQQATRLMFLWTTFIFGATRNPTLDAYAGSGWDLMFPERPQFPREIAEGIQKQFRHSDEITARKDGSFSLYEWELMYWLTVYALDPGAVDVPEMPIVRSLRGNSQVNAPSPEVLMLLPKWMNETISYVNDLDDE